MPENIGIVGAGIMGASIALALSSHGYAVKLKEIDQVQMEKGLANIDKLLVNWQKKGLSAEQAKISRNLIEPVKLYGDFQEAAFVIEAVAEDLTTKAKVFAELDQYCSKECLLASNTSTLSISQLA